MELLEIFLWVFMNLAKILVFYEINVDDKMIKKKSFIMKFTIKTIIRFSCI